MEFHFTAWPFIAATDWLIPTAIIFVVGILFFFWLQFRTSTYPYEKIVSICTKTEARFYQQLIESVKGDFLIFGKVRIADLLKVRKGAKNRLSWQNRINCKHIDFVLCDPVSLEIRVAIELDDRSHQRPDRIERDKFVNKAFEDASFPILRIKTADQYDQKLIRKTIERALSPQNRQWVYHIET